MRAATVIAGSIPYGAIEASSDGKTFRPLVGLPGAMQYRPNGLKTYAFPATTAKFFRVRFTAGGLASGTTVYPAAPTPANAYTIGEFIIHTGARVDRWEEKAAFNLFYEYEAAATPDVPAAAAVPRADVVDLTSKMDADGVLNWDVPPGKWTILRMGYSLTGARNRPSTPAGNAEERTYTSSPSSCERNPKPFSASYHFTRPVGTGLTCLSDLLPIKSAPLRVHGPT